MSAAAGDIVMTDSESSVRYVFNARKDKPHGCSPLCVIVLQFSTYNTIACAKASIKHFLDSSEDLEDWENPPLEAIKGYQQASDAFETIFAQALLDNLIITESAAKAPPVE